MRAPDLYQRLITVMETLGYQRWSTALGPGPIPEDATDRVFHVAPASVEPQSRLRAAASTMHAVSTTRKWRVTTLYRVSGSDILDVVRERFLPEEERITDLLLSLDEVLSAAVSYGETDEAGGVLALVFEVDTKYERPA